MGAINYYFNIFDETGEKVLGSTVTSLVIKRTADSVTIPSTLVTDNYKIAVSVSDAINEIVDIYVNGVKRASAVQLLGSGAITNLLTAISGSTVGNVVTTNAGQVADSLTALSDLVTDAQIQAHIDSATPHPAITGTEATGFGVDTDAVANFQIVNDAGEMKVRNKDNSAYGNLRVNDLVVEGTQTIIHSEELKVDDNLITVNANITGTPTEDGGLEVERGTSANAEVLWNETTDKWQVGVVGAMNDIITAGDLGATVAKGSGGRSTITTASATQKIYIDDDSIITKNDFLAGLLPPTGTVSYAGQVLADATDLTGGVLSEKVDQETITVDEVAHKLTLKRPKFSYVTTDLPIVAGVFYKIAETTISDPKDYYFRAKIDVKSTSGTTINHSLIVDVISNQNGIPILQVNSASSGVADNANTGVRYVRVIYPKTATSGVKAYVEVSFNDTTSRTITVTMLDSKNITLNTALTATEYVASNHNTASTQSLYVHGIHLPYGFFVGQLSGNATASTYTQFVSNYLHTVGENMSTYDIISIKSDGKLWKIANGAVFPLNACIGACQSTISAGTANGYIVTNGKFAKPTTLTVGATVIAGKDLYAGGSISGVTFVCDGTIVTELSASTSYKRIGYFDGAGAVIYYDGNNEVITLDASGRISAVDSRALYSADSDKLDGNDASAFALTGHTHTSTYQPIDADLTAIAGITPTSGILQKTAENTWSLTTVPIDRKENVIVETLNNDAQIYAQTISATTVSFKTYLMNLETGDYFVLDNEIQLLGTKVDEWGDIYYTTRAQKGTVSASHALNTYSKKLSITDTVQDASDVLKLITGALGTAIVRQVTITAFNQVIAKSSNVSSVSGTTVTLTDGLEYWIIGY